MKIKDTYSSPIGTVSDLIYKEIDNMESIRHLPIKAVGAICLYEEKMLVVYAEGRNCWEMPGGMIELGETFEQAITREILEESNMRVLDLFPLGYEVHTNEANPDGWYQLRFGARVEPIGNFSADPDGDITQIKLIDPKDYKKYFDWGERSDEMIQKTMRILASTL